MEQHHGIVKIRTHVRGGSFVECDCGWSCRAAAYMLWPIWDAHLDAA